MLELISFARGAYNGGQKTLTFLRPTATRKGDLLVALVVRDTATDLPAGWEHIETIGAAPEVLDVRARIVQDDEPATVVFTTAVSHEMQGVLLHMRGSTPAQLREASAASAFVATMTPTAPASTTQQAISWMVGVWSSSGAPVFTAPAGFTVIDTFSTSIVTPRALLVAYRIAKQTGAVAAAQATTNLNATGRAFTLTWRDRLPIQPAELVDPLPGNHGLMETSQ